MALKGNLQTSSMAQVLNLVRLAKQTGTLIIDGPGQHAGLAFRDGQLIHATIGQGEDLTTILYGAGKLTQEQAIALKARAGSGSDKEIALLLLDAGLLNQDGILAVLRQHMLEVVAQTLTWTDGQFRFEPSLLPGADKITVLIGLESVTKLRAGEPHRR